MVHRLKTLRSRYRVLPALLTATLVSGCFGDGGSATITETPVYDDAYWAALAQHYEPFVPEPNIGQAQGPEDLINEGRWSEVIAWPEIATGAANLPDGRIMTWSSTGERNFGGGTPFTHGSIFDPNTSLFTTKDNQVHNTFCAGVSLLPDGEIFAAGGGATITTTSIYADDEWSLVEDMQRPRWYATSTTLATGQVLTSLGDKFQPYPEMWTPNQGWELRTNLSMQTVLDDATGVNGQRHWYPAMMVAPDGTLIHPGPTSQLFSLDPSNPAGVIPHGSREAVDQHRLYNTTVMYDVGKLLVAGGGTPARSSAVLIDVNSSTPSVTAASPMNLPRSMHNSVVLPNGEVLVIGGNSTGVQFSDDGTQLVPEIWNPDTGVWSTLAPHSVPRNYHSTALLLKDGRVAVMGGGLCGGCATNHQDGEIFEPPYLFDANGNPAARPSITAGVSTGNAGDTVSLTGSDDIVEFNMLRLVALTHHHTSDQRMVPVPFQKPATGSYELALPANPNVVLPGYYWVFGLNAQGVPSIGHTIKIGVTEPLDSTDVPDTNAVTYEYYEGTWNNLPDFDSLTALATGELNSFNLSAAQQQDFFAMRFTAKLMVPADGQYTFFTNSDDGSQLFIDGQMVVNNDGLHAPVEKQGSIALTAGEHDIVVTVFEKTGGQSLAVQWSGPGITKQDVTGALVSQVPEPVDPVDPVDPPAPNLVTNGDFEQGTSSWLSCSDNTAIAASNDSFNGTGAALIEGCAYAEFAVSAGETYDLSCAANGNGSGFASISITFNNSDYVAQGSDELAVSGNSYANYSTRQVAPATSTTAALTLYAENGAALFDDCRVNVSTNGPIEPEPEPEPEPQEPEGNLIANASFEQDQAGWSSCATDTTMTGSNDASGGLRALQLQGCAFTEFDVQGNQAYRLSCSGKAGSASYASITLSYSDAGYTELTAQEIPLTSVEYGSYTLDLTAPVNSVNGALTVYADGAPALFDSCFVTPVSAAQ